jgi:hypothetical protein
VENSIPQHAVPLKQGGIGLDNLKRRLELLYPGKHVFVTEKKEHCFLAELRLEV